MSGLSFYNKSVKKFLMRLADWFCYSGQTHKKQQHHLNWNITKIQYIYLKCTENKYNYFKYGELYKMFKSAHYILNYYLNKKILFK